MGREYWHRKSTRSAKIDWLLEHQDMWEGWIEIGDSRKQGIFEAMLEDGLVSEKTYWRDLNLNRLINDARRKRRNR